MEIVLIIGLTLLNGLFAMSEMALASSRKPRLAALQDSGDRGAAAALALMAEPTRFLSTVQVGITSIGVLNGIVGEAAFSAPLSQWLMGLGLAASAAGLSATAIVVTVITFVTIIFGELVPKRIGQLYPEPVARVVARPMMGLARAAGPFVRLLTLSTQGVLRLLRIRSDGGAEVTQEEITASLAEGVSAGLIEANEHQMVRNVFHLDDRPLTSLMTPRSDMNWLDAGLTVAQALDQVGRWPVERRHAWYPVCRQGLSHVAGVISLTELLASSHTATLESLARAVPFVPETLSGMELLDQLRESAARMVLVVDEYGDVQGLLTPMDLLQAITGELKPETQAEAWAVPRGDGSWLLDGLMPIPELRARLELPALPGEDRGRYNTLAGLLLYAMGHLPVTGEKIQLGAWIFEVVDLDGRRIDKILAVPREAHKKHTT